MQNFTIKEVFSQYHGRCFTLTSDYPFSNREMFKLSIKIPHEGFKILAYAHEPGQVF